jgi:hypothetical protein
VGRPANHPYPTQKGEAMRPDDLDDLLKKWKDDIRKGT